MTKERDVATLAHNVEGYCTLGSILTIMRESTRRALTAAFGERWFESALPPELFGRLVARKEREKAVNAYSYEYFSIIEFADFLDLQEIHQQHPEVAAFLHAVSPNPQVRQTRLLELQSMLDKIAGVREINEAELSFLRNFMARLSHTVGPLPELSPDRSIWPAARANTSPPAPTPQLAPPPPVPTTLPTPAPAAAQAPPAVAPPAAAPAPLAVAPPAAPAPQPVVTAPAAPAPPPTMTAPAPAPQAAPPPGLAAASPGASAVAQVAAATVTSLPFPAPADRADEGAPHQASAALASASAQRSAARPATESQPVTLTPAPDVAGGLEAALASGDDPAIIDALYQEVLSLSESLTTSGGSRRPRVWESVVESPWYEQRFSALGLRPVSDYYDLYLAACARLREGASRAQLQDFLQAHAFPKVVLNVGLFFHQRRSHR